MNSFYETQAKMMYIEHRQAYRSRPKDKALRAEIDIFAGIHNHNRALFNKGVEKWENAVMKQFEEIENGGAFGAVPSNRNLTDDEKLVKMANSGEQIAYHGNMGVLTGDGAVFSAGEMIKMKRNTFAKLQKELRERHWWK